MKSPLIGLSIGLSLIAAACGAQDSLENDPDLAADGLCQEKITISEHPKSEPKYLPNWAVLYPGAKLQEKFLQCGFDNKPLRASANYRTKDDWSEVIKFIENKMAQDGIKPLSVFRGKYGVVYMMEDICENRSEIIISNYLIFNHPSETQISYQRAFCSHL